MLLLVLVVGIVLYTIFVLDLGPVLFAFENGHGIHLGDVVIFLLALPMVILLGRRFIDAMT